MRNEFTAIVGREEEWFDDLEEAIERILEDWHGDSLRGAHGPTPTKGSAALRYGRQS